MLPDLRQLFRGCKELARKLGVNAVEGVESGASHRQALV